MVSMLTIDDFKKVEICAGTIRAAERVPETDKLLRLAVDFGEAEPRTVVSGIAEHIDSAALVGTQCLFVTNLEPRIIRGIESNGMILALAGDDGSFSLTVPAREVPPGTKAR